MLILCFILSLLIDLIYAAPPLFPPPGGGKILPSGPFVRPVKNGVEHPPITTVEIRPGKSDINSHIPSFKGSPAGIGEDLSFGGIGGGRFGGIGDGRLFPVASTATHTRKIEPYNGGFGNGYIAEAGGIIGGDGGNIDIGKHHKPRNIPAPIPVPIPKPYPRPQPRPRPRPQPVPIRVPYPVQIPYPVDVPRPYPVHVPQPIQIEVPRPYPIPVPKPYPVPVDRVSEYGHGRIRQSYGRFGGYGRRIYGAADRYMGARYFHAGYGIGRYGRRYGFRNLLYARMMAARLGFSQIDSADSTLWSQLGAIGRFVNGRRGGYGRGAYGMGRFRGGRRYRAGGFGGFGMGVGGFGMRGAGGWSGGIGAWDHRSAGGGGEGAGGGGNGESGSEGDGGVGGSEGYDWSFDNGDNDD